RIGRLGSGARRAVRAASVFGQTFWQGGIAAVLGVTNPSPEIEGWLAALTDAELIQPHSQSGLSYDKEYRFRHALVKDAAYSLLTARDIATGHLRAGEFLESSEGLDAAMIAEHFEHGGDKPRAARHFLRAAEQNLLRGNHLGAIRYAERGA